METNKPIRVLQMIASFTRGGSQSVVMNLYRNIDRTKIQFDFIIDHIEYSGYEDEIKQLGGKVFIMPTFKGSNIKEIKKVWNNFFIEHPEYKILHSHSRSYASIYLPIAKKYGVKTIIHSHSTSNGKGLKAVAKDMLQYPLRYQADYYMACSIDAGKWLFGEKVTKSDRFHILKNAINSEKYIYNEKIRNEYRKSFNILDDEIVYIQISNFIKIKNHLFTLDCFSNLLKVNSNCRLFIVGTGDEESTRKIINKINELNLQDYVTTLGMRDDVNNLLQMADYYLMPSIYEGISLAAIEAQTSDINCLLSDTVSKDVKVIDKCKFLALNQDLWIREMSKPIENRRNNYDIIVNAGYDVGATSIWLTNFYEDIVNE